MTRLALCLAFLAAASSALAHFEHQARHSHDRLAAHKRDPGQHDRILAKRVDNAPFTEFETGLGACGNTNTDSDFIVALNSAMFDSGNYCGQTITITANGKTASATIQDRCGTCAANGVDLTPSLFEVFAELSSGQFFGTFVIGDAQPTTSSSETPTSTYTPPSSTSTWSSTTSWSTSSSTTFSTSSTTLSSSSTSLNSMSTLASGSASATAAATGVTAPQGVISMFDYGIMQLGLLVADAASDKANVGQTA